MKVFFKRSLYITMQVITVLWLLAVVGVVVTLSYFGLLYIGSLN